MERRVDAGREGLQQRYVEVVVTDYQGANPGGL